MIKTRTLAALGAALALIVGGLPAVARACGTDMTVPTLADHAAQVIVAEIRAARSYWAADPRRIETELTLVGVEYLKGGYEGAPTETRLIVPGGAVGDWQMRLCCAPDYRPGERWVLFVLPTCKVHPIVGMDRGSFRVITDERGVDRVRTASGLAIEVIDAEGRVRVVGGDTAHAHDEPKRAHGDVRIATLPTEDAAAARLSDAMTLASFRESLGPVLRDSRDHGLREPAGRRVEADFRAVPLKEVERNDAASEGVTP